MENRTRFDATPKTKFLYLILHVRYEIEEIGSPDLEEVLKDF